MVLLQGLNYDLSGQETTKTTLEVIPDEEKIRVKSSSGFSDNDYFVIGMNTDKSEIVQIISVNSLFEIATTSFKYYHEPGAVLFRVPYNKMRFYESTTSTGTYTLIDTVDMDYQRNYTNYNYLGGSHDNFYKRTFYNEELSEESDIGLSDYWQTNAEEMILSPEQLRIFLQYAKEDMPPENETRDIIKIANSRVNLELSSGNREITFLANLLASKFYFLKAMGSRAVSKGYVTVNVAGRNVTKAYQEIVLDAENVWNEYKSLLRNLAAKEVSSTNFMNKDYIFKENRQFIIDIMNGTQNAIDNDATLTNLGRRRRYG